MTAAYTALAIIGIVAVGLLLLGIYCSACHIQQRAAIRRRVQDILPVSQIGTEQRGGSFHVRANSGSREYRP